MIDISFRYTRLQEFRLSLLRVVLLTASFFSISIATLSLFLLFPLTMPYTVILYSYGVINIIGYLLLNRNTNIYSYIVQLCIIGSLITFTIMTYVVRDDEFRLVWFFLTAFASYILGGKRYGFIITAFIIIILLYLYSHYDLKLSIYAIFTFFCALIVFNTFAYAFLKKIENDEYFFQKRVEDEIALRHSQELFLVQQYRLASMGEMIDAIAHQWRQPLMHSNMIIFNMQEEFELKSCPREYIEEKMKSLIALNQHMSKTIDDFRKILSTKKQIESFSSSVMVDEVVNIMSKGLQSIEVRREYKDINITTYKNELIQVLLIVLSNAIEILDIRDIDKPIITFDILQDESCITIAVIDNGGGVDISHIDKIFDPYFTTKKDSGGTGLGLYIASIIMHKSIRGDISCANTEIGTKITIRVPND